jgi:hypothetical protein
MIQDAATRAALEPLYSLLLSAVVVMARLLGKPCPVMTRAERRAERSAIDYVEKPC